MESRSPRKLGFWGRKRVLPGKLPHLGALAIAAVIVIMPASGFLIAFAFGFHEGNAIPWELWRVPPWTAAGAAWTSVRDAIVQPGSGAPWENLIVALGAGLLYPILMLLAYAGPIMCAGAATLWLGEDIGGPHSWLYRDGAPSSLGTPTRQDKANWWEDPRPPALWRPAHSGFRRAVGWTLHLVGLVAVGYALYVLLASLCAWVGGFVAALVRLFIGYSRETHVI